MEEKREEFHQLILGNRQNGKLSGIRDVYSFDSECILLETSCGMLEITGSDLHMERLQLEQGEVDIAGTINRLVYAKEGSYGSKQKGGLIKRLFQ